MGSDMVVGSAQSWRADGLRRSTRGFLATTEEYKRLMRELSVFPSMQTGIVLENSNANREQHIRRDSDVEHLHSASFVVNMAAMYAIYHGPEGLKDIKPEGA